jgi:hypothetical protein
MTHGRFSQRMKSYDAWKSDVVQTLDELQNWLEQRELSDAETDLRLYETMEALRQDRLTLAFVAEFSRGKTELINAIFFAEYGRRLLPSEAGRTTMCTTELFFDRTTEQSFVHLLPIETRREERSIIDYKREPGHWVSMPLNIESPDQMAAALREVVRTKQVKLDDALALGLYDESQDPQYKKTGKRPALVEIPIWRHARISFPHPLLQQGLVILDTPGLNALGSEPELTISMLPSAQAVMFVLAADTGVTRSDLDMWEHHVHSMQDRHNRHLIIALNKIDTLWDGLSDDCSVSSTIDAQCGKVAELLGVQRQRVFPVSAQKGLVAKVRQDAGLLAQSRVPELEQFLAETVLPNKIALLRDHMLENVGGLIESAASALQNRHDQIKHELHNLNSLRGKNADVIQHLMKKSREEQTAYLRNVESFQGSRRILQNQAKAMMETLSLGAFDRLINKTRAQMTNSWTTVGLNRAMKTFFDGATEAMGQASLQSEQTRMLIRATYRKFHEEHGLPAITPKIFSVDKYNMELHQLQGDADAFRNSAITAMTEQGFVIKKFFISLVSRARSNFFKANQDAELWLKEVMNPLVKQIRDHRRVMEKRLDTLRRISESRNVLDSKIRELTENQSALSTELSTLRCMQDTLACPLPDGGQQTLSKPRAGQVA